MAVWNLKGDSDVGLKDHVAAASKTVSSAGSMGTMAADAATAVFHGDTRGSAPVAAFDSPCCQERLAQLFVRGWSGLLGLVPAQQHALSDPTQYGVHGLVQIQAKSSSLEARQT
jgi:hypothetical protein